MASEWSQTTIISAIPICDVNKGKVLRGGCGSSISSINHNLLDLIEKNTGGLNNSVWNADRNTMIIITKSYSNTTNTSTFGSNPNAILSSVQD